MGRRSCCISAGSSTTPMWRRIASLCLRTCRLWSTSTGSRRFPGFAGWFCRKMSCFCMILTGKCRILRVSAGFPSFVFNHFLGSNGQDTFFRDAGAQPARTHFGCSCYGPLSGARARIFRCLVRFRMSKTWARFRRRSPGSTIARAALKTDFWRWGKPR